MLLFLRGTPLWVWVAFAYVLFIGLKSMHNLKIFLPLTFFLPIVLIGTKYTTLIYANNIFRIGYLGALIFGIFLGYMLHKDNLIKFFKNSYYIEIPANYSTLFLLISIFVVRFYFGYYRATYIIMGQNLFLVEMIISGFLPGYFLGRAGAYVRQYKSNCM